MHRTAGHGCVKRFLLASTRRLHSETKNPAQLSLEELRLSKLNDSIVTAVKNGDRGRWKYPNTRNGERRRLEAALDMHPFQRRPLPPLPIDDSNFFAGHALESTTMDEFVNSRVLDEDLEPGAFIEYRT